MIHSNSKRFTIIILLIFWLACISLYPYLPEQVPIHWNIYGQVDGYGSKATAALILPLLPLVIYVLLSIMPLIDPLKENYEKFAVTYEFIKVVIAGVMGAISGVVLLSAIGFSIDVSLAVRFLVSALFFLIGACMGQIKPNYFIGIRVPWTLASEEVWIKTHRFAARIMMIGSLLALFSTFFSSEAGFVLFMAGILAPLFIATLYSYFLYRKLSPK